MKAIPLLLALVINISLHCMELDQAHHDNNISQEVSWAQGILFKDCLTDEEKDSLIRKALEPMVIDTIEHPSGVLSVAYSPHNPNLLGTGCQDGIARIWDLSSYSILQSLNHCNFFDVYDVNAVAFNPHDLTQFATGCSDGKVRIWDLTNDLILQTLTHPNSDVLYLPSNKPAPYRVTAIAFIRDNSNLLGTGCQDGIARIWNLISGSVKYSFAHSDCIRAIEFSPHNPTQFATGGSDGKVRIWDLTSSTQLSCYTHSYSDTIAFNPHDSTQLVIGSCGNVHILNLMTGKTIQQSLPHLDRSALRDFMRHFPPGKFNDDPHHIERKFGLGVTSIAFNPHTSTQLATGCFCDNKVRIWDISKVYLQSYLSRPKKYLSEVLFLKRLAIALKHADQQFSFSRKRTGTKKQRTLPKLMFEVGRDCPLDLDNPPEDANEQAIWEHKLIKYIPGGIEHGQQKEYFWRFTQMPDAVKVIARKVMKFAKE